MKNLILPGYSIKNKDWAETTQKELKPELNFEVIYWKHWKDESLSGSIVDRELPDLIKLVGEEPVNIIAKSIATLIAVHLLKNAKIEKLILCGIPLNDIVEVNEEDKKYYEILKDFDVAKLLVIQNEGDPHGSFSNVEKFIHQINPEIRIISKPASDHEYYYTEDIKEFLKS